MPRAWIARSTRSLVAVGSLALAAGLLAGCGSDASSGGSVALPSGCRQVAKPPPKDVDLRPPSGHRVQARSATATVDTSCGRFVIALDPAGSPRTVRSFEYLARRGVYDHTAFHRIVPGFVIQGGDPTETGSGGPGYSIQEPPPPSTVYSRGTVAMAKTAVEPPGRSGSQFFVVIARDAGLPPSYAVLGKVTSGQRVVDRIGSLGDPASGQAGTPTAAVQISSIRIGPR